MMSIVKVCVCVCVCEWEWMTMGKHTVGMTTVELMVLHNVMMSPASPWWLGVLMRMHVQQPHTTPIHHPTGGEALLNLRVSSSGNLLSGNGVQSASEPGTAADEAPLSPTVDARRSA